MNTRSQAKIISYNFDNNIICASAARISTTEGDANFILEKSRNNSANDALIKKVLQSGHRSIIEHAVFNISLCNVSAFVEQYFIEFRLASFTVKSRRYVNFSNQGYYIPSDLAGTDIQQYCQYMDSLFEAYHSLLNVGIPKEDARFLLPYSFCSNFYCTINARELINLIRSIKFGRGKKIPELCSLADQIIEQITHIFPCILDELISSQSETERVLDIVNDIDNTAPIFLSESDMGYVKMLNFPNNPESILDIALKTLYPWTEEKQVEISKIVVSERPRVLEQLNYTFMVSNVSLSGITHLARHRMQSIIIPSIKSLKHIKYTVPKTIEDNCEAFSIYQEAITEINKIYRLMKKSESLNKYIYYYALSGNVMDIMTTMNARELLLFIKLRSCNRAQWEVRNISNQILEILRNHFPKLYNCYGPSCFINGKCPEGEKTCGRMENTIKHFNRNS